MRSIVRATAAAVLTLAVSATAVAAHECYVVNRSSTGNTAATHSARWYQLTLGEIFASTEFFGLPDLTTTQVAWAVARAGSLGVPSSFTIRTDKVIGEGAAAFATGGHSADGRGVDHFIDAYGATIVGVVFEAVGH